MTFSPGDRVTHVDEVFTGVRTVSKTEKAQADQIVWCEEGGMFMGCRMERIDDNAPEIPQMQGTNDALEKLTIKGLSDD